MLQSVAHVAGIRNFIHLTWPRLAGRRQFWRRLEAHTFALQQRAFLREPAAIFDQRTIGADQAMTATALSRV
jgi:hypothetical protein